MADIRSTRVLTFDVGGTHVSAAVCLGKDYQLGPVVSEVYGIVETSDAFVDFLGRLGKEASVGCKDGMGATLAMPGPFDFKAGVSLMRHKLPYLYGVDLRRALAMRLGCQPSQVRFLNDADAYLLGEVGAGAARGFGRAVGLTLGTGIGSAFSVNGRIVTGGPGVPPEGEIWNVPYESGIVEDYLSTRAIAGSYLRLTGRVREVADLATLAADDPAAQEAFAEFGKHLGRLLGTLLTRFEAEVVVLGGGISRSPELFLPATQSYLGDRSFALKVSELRGRAPLVGCGVAWFDETNGSFLSAKAAPERSEGI